MSAKSQKRRGFQDTNGSTGFPSGDSVSKKWVCAWPQGDARKHPAPPVPHRCCLHETRGCFISDSHLQMRSRVIAWKKEASRHCASWRWGWYWSVQRIKPNRGIKLRSGSLKTISLSLCFFIDSEQERGAGSHKISSDWESSLSLCEVDVCAIRLTRRKTS